MATSSEPSVNGMTLEEKVALINRNLQVSAVDNGTGKP